MLKLSDPAQARMGNRPLTNLRAAVRGVLELAPTLSKDLPTLRRYSKTLLAALNDIITRLEPNHPSLCKAEFFIELAARIWKATPDNSDHLTRVNAAVAYLEELAQWLGKDGLLDLKEGTSLSRQVVDIYDTVRARIPKRVFLARWYPTAKDGEDFRRAKLRLKQIQQTLKDIHTDLGLTLELIDMGAQKGGTFPIHSTMYDSINSSDIVLIDLSGVRPNVCVEAGYALRDHEKNRVIFIFQPTKSRRSVPFDLNTFSYIPFEDTGELPEKLKPHITAIVRAAAAGH